MTQSEKTLIIGAGLSGLTAARVLVDAGRSVSVIDKGRGVGGRLATRRIGDARLDHGAQFFTVRGDDFRSVIDEAQAAGVVDVWCHGFGEEDGYPRYYCPAGMTALAKWMTENLRAKGVSIETGQRASHIEATKDGWRLPIDGSRDLRSSDHDRHGENSLERVGKSLIVTAPVPQTIDLLTDGNVELGPGITQTLATITYKPTFALLVTLDAPSALTSPGGVQQTEADLFTFISDNKLKGVSEVPALTFHVNGEVSTNRWDDAPEAIIADLLVEAAPWIGEANIVDTQLQKWKFAGPYTPHPERHLVAATEPGLLVLAGDAFGGPKVEGAFNSGLSAGNAVAEA